MTERAPECQDCGHPEPKHSRGRRGGCAVRVAVHRGARSGAGRTQLRECGCAVYRAPDGTTAPTIAELIERDRANLAELADQGRVHLRLGGKAPGIYVDGERI